MIVFFSFEFFTTNPKGNPSFSLPSLVYLYYLSWSSQKKQDNKAPDKDAILKATSSLSTRHTDRTVTQHNIRDVRFLVKWI